MTLPLLPLFALTLFLSALLLFLVQPLVGKIVLPYLGGTPAVWNTCMVFFQALLLVGYSYAHYVPRWLRPRTQLLLHATLLVTALVPLALLRFDVGALARDGLPPPREANPIPWLLLVLLLTAGLPFFVASTSAPLLQRWFAGTTHTAAKDPYFLYAASNLGSLLALVAYPSLLEPNLGLVQQAATWILAYSVLILLILLCGTSALRVGPAHLPAAHSSTEAEPPSLLRCCRWVALAFVPSSLLLGVTTHMTTDLAAIPLLWILPLVAYLLSFVLVFSSVGRWIHAPAVLLLPLVILIVAREDNMAHRLVLKEHRLIFIHLRAFFIAAIVCHGELARTRPSARYLTTFYLLLSLGGVLGGIFNTLIAPAVLDRIAEYPLMLVLALVLMPRLGWNVRQHGLRRLDTFFAVVLAGCGVLGGVFFWAQRYRTQEDVAPYVEQLPEPVRPLAELLTSWLREETHIIHRERNFYGTFTVSAYGNYYLFNHGTTTHGIQDHLHPSEPLTYFHRWGAIGQLFESVQAKSAGRPLRVAVLGVGTGTLAAYLQPGWELTLFEIDPAVVRIARDRQFFTFLSDAEDRGVKIQVVLGDGRLQLQEAPDATYDLLFMDAFTSDAVPVHLLTREAMQIYLRKLAPGGLLIVNIANRYLTLNPALGNLADDLGLEGRHQRGDGDDAVVKFPSSWVVLARSEADFGDLLSKKDDENGWEPLQRDPKVGVWTDDYSNLLRVFQWQR